MIIVIYICDIYNIIIVYVSANWFPFRFEALEPSTGVYSADLHQLTWGKQKTFFAQSLMTVADQVRADITSAMKAGEKDRVGALRLVLSELQKSAKEGSDDELAVLRRERKRRLDAAAQFRDGGRPELADGEESEARLIEGYLPAELDDAELRGDRAGRDRRDRRRRARGTWDR